eukprot:1151490-Pelagomonas_calceolata.AAC.4
MSSRAQCRAEGVQDSCDFAISIHLLKGREAMVLEVPVPKYFIEDRAKELDDRDKFLEALVEKYHVKPIQVGLE